MITLAPVEDKQTRNELYAKSGLSENQNSSALAAVCKDEIIGFSLYDLDSKRMTVRYIEPLEDISLADGILRSTLHVAAERSVMDAFYEDTVPEAFLEKIGFIKDKAEKRLDIDKLFKSCCGCSE